MDFLRGVYLVLHKNYRFLISSELFLVEIGDIKLMCDFFDISFYMFVGVI